MANIKTKEELVAMAKIAATQFTTKNIPLNETLVKIAKEEGLVHEQIDFLAQEANKQAWSMLYKTDKDKAYFFETADSDKIYSLSREGSPVEVKNEADLDFLLPPSSNFAGSISVVKTAGLVDTSRGRKEVIRDISMKLEKLSHVKSEIYMRLLEKRAEADAEAEKAIVEIKNELLQLPYSERPKAFRKVAAAIYSLCKDRKESLEISNHFKNVLEKLGVMQKTAALEAPEQYISENMPATVVNGNNVIIVRIKTFIDRALMAKELESRLQIVDDTIPKLKEALREL